MSPLTQAAGMEPEHPMHADYEYERNGVRNLFLFFEPLAGKRHILVSERRTKVDWAYAMCYLADELYPNAEVIVVVMDNLNTHGPDSFYEVFEPAEARRLRERFEFHYTPKHGSWLNMAEIELSALVENLSEASHSRPGYLVSRSASVGG